MRRYLILFMLASAVCGMEQQLASPDGTLTCTISDSGGLHYALAVGETTVMQQSTLGLEFENEVQLGPYAAIVSHTITAHTGSWENRFGQRRTVDDTYRELHLQLTEAGTPVRRFGLLVRAYNNGIAFRYELPKEAGLGDFVLTRELTGFNFTGDYRCWAGKESTGAECQYPQMTLSKIPTKTGDNKRKGQPFLSCLPLLVETPAALVAVAESDLLDWAGMFVSGSGTANVIATLAKRSDGHGAVVSSVPCVSPWRVLMIGRTAKELLGTDLIATLATPNRLGDVAWVVPGACAWDAWWTGLNAGQPKFTGTSARGDTASHMAYIDLAAEMGWPYQLVDWFWYKGDLTKPLPHIDIPAIVAHAQKQGVKLFLWMHSADLQKADAEQIFAMVAQWSFIGVKIDFMDSDSQETVAWYAKTLETAAKHHLMVDFHSAYKPTGLARTYPNFITQEGVLGNEYNKLRGNQCTPLHTVTLPFTRGLLGPMDFTPGGFVNRAPKDFTVTFPAQVMGTRARQLAMTVLYLSPLQVLCDSPANYRGQPGVEFLRALPTTWDESVVLEATVGNSLAIARRCGTRWYIGAMNGDEAATLTLPGTFLGSGTWTMRQFADQADAPATAVEESSRKITAQDTLTVRLQPAGGFAAICEMAAP